MTYRYCPMCSDSLVERADPGNGGKVRLACPSGHWTHWDNPLPVLAALVEINGKILLVRSMAGKDFCADHWVYGARRNTGAGCPENLRPWRTGTGHAMADWMCKHGLPVEFLDWPAS